ncbi:phosphoesterase [Streptococcus varani]|uniref:Phosphoesterase n=1 Tax=Streptococcus varani TaxID=1608583 RepID=A0A0E4H784_9STRE|nr:metallophosphoesterase [Streptococcus varani]CQR24329.1 phosphoesterase [Streptococcus varani]
MAEEASKTILVMSDSHGNRQVLEELKGHYWNKVDAIFHNGDSELDSEDPIWDGIQVVCGNCDFDGGYPDNLLTELEGVRIAQTHGHLYRINYTWQNLDYWAQEMDADICLYGHLHAAAAEKRGKTLFLNPGSVQQPRGLIQVKLYALITITDSCFKVRFYDLNHQEYTPLTKDIPR